MIKTLKELVGLVVGSEDTIVLSDMNVVVTKDSFDTFFDIGTKSPYYVKSVKLPNDLIIMIFNDITFFNATSYRVTRTLLYYMLGFNPKLSVKELATIDHILRGVFE